ncbi:MAG: C45 family autoproteolytic acyltransferase/hydrolase [Planctomycetota bacterium]|jgi:hypothetical protein
MRSRILTGANGFLLALLAILSHLVGLTYGANVPAPPPVRQADLADLPAELRSRLRIVDGVPLLRLSGTPREIGEQHGRLLRPQIRYLLREFYEAFALKLVGDEGIDEWVKQVTPHIPEHYREEMRGIAKGAGVSEETVLRVNCIVDKLQTVLCSTVVAAGKATKSDEVIFGRNLDFIGRNILHRTTVVLALEPTGKQPIVSVTWPGLIGVLSGMNKSGVCGATMMIHHGTNARPGVPYMLMYRDALVAANKTADVAKHFEATKRTIPNNFTVVDATGASEVIEYDATRMARRPANGGGVCSTNHFRSNVLEGVGWRLGVRRYATLETFLHEQHGKIDYEGVRQALRDTAKPYYLNVQSMIFLPKKRELHISVGGKLPAAAQRFVTLDKKMLFGGDS